jgi:uncharacterized YigZ family protein
MQEMSDNYRTIEKSSQGVFKTKGSKFLAFAFPVDDETRIKEIIDRIRSEYYTASHHCYAWKLGAGSDNFRTFDDGEPTNTAGKPILGQIRKHDLTDIIVIVVRYFGGTLLGTGGLMAAYREAAAMALEQAEIITRTINELFSLKFPYTSMNVVMKVLKEEQAYLAEQEFSAGCALKVIIPRDRADRMTNRLRAIENIVIIKVD